MSVSFESVAPRHHLEFGTDSVRNRNYRTHFKRKRRQHRTEFMQRQRIVAIHQQISTPIAHAYHEELNLEIGGSLPLTENLEDPRLGLFVFGGRTLRAFVPRDHVLHLSSGKRVEIEFFFKKV